MFSFTVIGCGELVVPRGAHISMGVNVAIVTCDVTGVNWRMTCIGAIWTGDTQKCDSGKIVLYLKTLSKKMKEIDEYMIYSSYLQLY